MHAEPRRLRHGAKDGAGAALAVGAGNVDDRRQPAFRMAELAKQCLQPFQAKIDQPWVQLMQPRDDAVDAGGGHDVGGRGSNGMGIRFDKMANAFPLALKEGVGGRGFLVGNFGASLAPTPPPNPLPLRGGGVWG